MARLSNGLETMELGVTSWRIIINDNFKMLYTKGEVDNLLKEYQSVTKLNETLKEYAKVSELKSLANGDKTKDFMVKNIDIAGVLKLSKTDVPYSQPPNKPSGYFKVNLDGKEVAIAYYDIN
ncbi:hypothetical protein [Campylobacter corcagiensis]|uniref:Uncharacterized protein n=1 Tax=Campylobacter corcagiensis TaxID=1448857 RepID=A0A7M1LFA6_9BACT|nr:hypothetical protein [Campylobacter corcagiensis]QKF64558.1 hypothetical protein CCORG_0697 [Campylobacter corcagiensis]QOQ87267.1 hypothetical protein IMC76_08685 [Campylobacter corcagiensis]